MIEIFNRALVQLSHRLISRRLLRQQVLPERELAFHEIMARDESEKGYLTHSEVISLWLGRWSGESQQALGFLGEVFPFPQISYSEMVDMLMGSSACENQPNILSREEVGSKMEELLTLEVQIYLGTLFIQEKISQLVPSAYLKPTKKEFYQYVACHQLGVDVEALAKALRLPDLPPPKEKVSFSQEWGQGLEGPSISSLQRTMGRLKERVGDLGKGWLE